MEDIDIKKSKLEKYIKNNNHYYILESLKFNDWFILFDSKLSHF
jgi:hypothetical protein